MKIKKTKQEKTIKAKEKAKKAFDVLVEKVEKYGEADIEFSENDFKKKLSTNIGWGFQDMKEKNQRLIKGLFTKGYDVLFSQPTDGSVGVIATVKKDND